MTNWQTRRAIDDLEHLVEVSIHDQNKKEKWLRLLPRYRTFMEQLRSKEDWNTSEEVSAFQDNIDRWFQDWNSLYDEAGMSNYVHLLCSGHISEYVYQWGNLYEHSQQGWEAFNALMKTFFFRRTARGGGKTRSRLKPIAKWLQRRVLFLCGWGEQGVEDFLSELASNNQ